ncbi:MAG: acetoacetate--CoA ligase [Pseudomonadota bacterium]
MEQPLWSPNEQRIENSHLIKFLRFSKLDHENYHDLWQWSVDHSEEFWNNLWDYCGVVGEKGDVALKAPDKMIGAQFFPNGKINYAENLLQKRSNDPAIIFQSEIGLEQTLSFDDLYDQVSLWVQVFEELGIQKGDRIAAYLPNLPETIIAYLACASIGAIWSSASPDFGAQGVIDRFGQIEPKIFIAVDGYTYNGKEITCLDKVEAVTKAIPSIEKTFIIPFLKQKPDLSSLSNAINSNDFLHSYQPKEIEFKRVSFNDPLCILFSSGTTGIPKCIVHGHGGTLLQHLKEHYLQCDTKENDRVFYFTTCGWMMWNWLVSALAVKATVILYDGNPCYPKIDSLWSFTSKYRSTFFGTSAKYIDTLRNHNIKVGEIFDLSDLKIITSTGSPLVHESFDYIYNNIKSDLHVASISGGTDIISCFVLGNPISPVYRGEIQGAGLAMALDVFDDHGQSVEPGSSGELVCTKPFPSMPVSFWNDETRAKYEKAYFSQFENIWSHGDWVEKTSHNGFIIHGRSDATLNPGGVRIGTAEIYRQVEKIDEVFESIAVGYDKDGDTQVILFVRLKDNLKLGDELKTLICKTLKAGASPRHVPAHIIQITDIPRTKSGKITELAVKEVLHGRPVKNIESLANPESLKLYENLNLSA